MSNRKQMMDIDKKNAMSAALSDEHQRKWDQEQWKTKQEDPERNYDFSRQHLNFEINKDRKIVPIDTSRRINEKIEERLAAWKKEQKEQYGKNVVIRSTQHKSVNIVYGGNRERMLDLAFGDQEIGERGTNENIVRMPQIEQWALDIYDYSCREFGKENIVSFIVHCDETSPHIHCVVTPITPDGRLSAKAMFGGNSKQEAAAHLRLIHDHLAEVNEKWGLERGDDIHVTGAVHKTLREHNRELHKKNLSLEDEIKRKERAIKGLTTMIHHLQEKESAIESKLTALQQQLSESDSDKESIEKAIRQLEQQLDETKLQLVDKNSKLISVNQSLEELQTKFDKGMKNLDIIHNFQNNMQGELNKNVDMILKASIFYDVLRKIVLVCREKPEVAALFEDTFIDDENDLRFNDVLNTAGIMFLRGVDGATNIAPGSVGGGSTSELPWRDKDEDIKDYARRCMWMAHRKCYPERRSKGRRV